jgi:L-histidine N-alpha-methyltransferase
MESYLVSLEKQKVFIQEIGQSFVFEPWEPIHTEYSYKYLESDIELLAQETGFVTVQQLYDSNRYFTDCIWEVHKSDGLEGGANGS